MGDAHVFRIHTYDHSSTIAGATAEREVTADYYQHEHGFITFKDNSGGSLYTVREELVHQIERLRTHVILAIASEELDLILTGLRERAEHLGNDPRDSITAREARQVALLAESLERLRPIASLRAGEDASSLPRVAVPPTFIGTNDEGKLVAYGEATQDA